MALPPLVKTVYTCGPDDDLVVVDAYTANNQSVLTSISEYDASLKDFEIAELNGILDKAQKESGEVIDGALVDEDMCKRMVGDDPEMMAELAAVAKDNDKSFFPTGGGGLLNTVSATLGGVTSAISSMNLSSVMSITKLADNLMGTRGGYPLSIGDLGAKSSLLNGLAMTGSRVGMPNVFSSVSNSAGFNKNISVTSAQRLLPVAAKQGNMNLFTDIAGSNVGSFVGRVNPGITSTFISNFKLPKGLTGNTLAATYQNLSRNFSNLESNWNRSKVGSLETFAGYKVGGNPAFMSAMKADVYSKAQPIPSPTTEGGNTTMPISDSPESYLLAMEEFPVSTVEDHLCRDFAVVPYVVDKTQDVITSTPPTNITDSNFDWA